VFKIKTKIICFQYVGYLMMVNIELNKDVYCMHVSASQINFLVYPIL